jgi:hypothetical protein
MIVISQKCHCIGVFTSMNGITQYKLFQHNLSPSVVVLVYLIRWA